MDLPKSYYLPPYRSRAAGIILIIFGLCICFAGIDFNNSFWSNLQGVLLSFESIGHFIGSLIMLLFKAGFLAGGYLYIKYADGVERARLDKKGFYYREIPNGSRFAKTAMDIGPLTFVPYSAISAIALQKSFWLGRHLILTLNARPAPLVALGVLKACELEEIAAYINSRIAEGA